MSRVNEPARLRLDSARSPDGLRVDWARARTQVFDQIQTAQRTGDALALELLLEGGLLHHRRARDTYNSPMKLITAQKMSEMIEMRSRVRFSCTVPLLGIPAHSGPRIWI